MVGVQSMEAVQEFKVLTNTYDAQYGRTGGGIVTMSGGNAIHSTAYEYFQAEELNANQSELNRVGTKKPPMNIDTFGIQASGPVHSPKLFDGRNSFFWLISYEGLRQRSADPGSVNFPLSEWRTGDFSALQNAQGQPVTLYDPLTTDAFGNRTAFPNNQIPASRINPGAAQVLKFYSSSNAPSSVAAFSPTDSYSLQPNMNWIERSHSLKYGAEFRRYNDNTNNPGAATGVYDFGRNWTQQRALQADAASGNEFASFRLGYPTSASVDRNIDPSSRSHYYAVFLQDYWKLTPRITLDLGFRWDYETPLVERYDRRFESHLVAQI